MHMIHIEKNKTGKHYACATMQKAVYAKHNFFKPPEKRKGKLLTRKYVFCPGSVMANKK